jgi:hypothetical protein
MLGTLLFKLGKCLGIFKRFADQMLQSVIRRHIQSKMYELQNAQAFGTIYRTQTNK